MRVAGHYYPFYEGILRLAEIDYYTSEQFRARIAATFKFSGVSTYNENSSIDELKTFHIW